MTYKIIIKDGKNKTYYHRDFLKTNNCVFKKTGKYTGYWFVSTNNESTYNYFKNYCKKNYLKCILKNDINYSRSNDYRNNYFESNDGILGSNYYQCVYCGRIIKKNKITIDHLIPIYKVESSRYSNFYRSLLSKLKIDNINNVNNLVSACSSCNSKKGSKTGLWIIRGIIGKYFIFWLSVYVLFFIFFIYAIFTLCNFYNTINI